MLHANAKTIFIISCNPPYKQELAHDIHVNIYYKLFPQKQHFKIFNKYRQKCNTD